MIRIAAAAAICSACLAAGPGVDPAPAVASTPAPAPVPGYVVVAGLHAAGNPGWKAVAEQLRTTHGVAAPVVVFDDDDPASLAKALAPLKPAMVGIVLDPMHAGRATVGALHRAMRQLDDDPTCDARWGILTARTAAGAMELAKPLAPLRMTSAAGTADFPMQLFPQAEWWSEEAAHRFTLHEPGKPDRPLTEKDVGDAVASMMNAPRLDLVMSGGHATEKGLELGFRKRAGWLGPKDGRMVVQCADGRTIPVTQHAPKAWIGVGNCLLGHVSGPDSLAAVAVEDFGVRAHVGYVVVTWYGRGGWGTLERFTKEPGRRTLNEAWTENCDAIVTELAKRFPGAERFACASWDRGDLEQFERDINEWADAHHVDEKDRKDLAGLVWDRDAVMYLGDPAWDVRVAERSPAPVPAAPAK
jgi:hypothetical protein